MHRRLIIGAGGFGREMHSWLVQSPGWNTQWRFGGFLDNNAAVLDGFGLTPGIVGTVSGFAPGPDDELVCAVGDPKTRLAICRHLMTQGAVFPVVRHPSAVVGEGCSLGAGCILCPGTVLSCNIELGRLVVVNLGATIGHDAKVGDGVTLSPHVSISGFAQLGEGAFLGSNASVLPRAKVGAYAKVGAGSVVLRVVRPGATAMGVPAKHILP